MIYDGLYYAVDLFRHRRSEDIPPIDPALTIGGLLEHQPKLSRELEFVIADPTASRAMVLAAVHMNKDSFDYWKRMASGFRR